MFLRTALIFTLCFAALAHGEEPKVIHLNPDRTVAIVGVITDKQTERVMKMAMAALSSNEPIDILIDSPGGYVDGGDILLQAITKLKDRGLVVRCEVKQAASMAMIILGACSERYAMPNSHYLWHMVRATVDKPLTAEEAQDLADELKALDNKYNPALQEALELDDETYWASWKAEKWWDAAELIAASPHFMTQIDGTDGVDWPKQERGFPGLGGFTPALPRR